MEEEPGLANELMSREVTTALTMPSVPEKTETSFFDWPSATKADRIDVALYKYFEMINTTEENKASLNHMTALTQEHVAITKLRDHKIGK